MCPIAAARCIRCQELSIRSNRHPRRELCTIGSNVWMRGIRFSVFRFRIITNDILIVAKGEGEEETNVLETKRL